MTVVTALLGCISAALGLVIAHETYKHETTGDDNVWRLEIALLFTSLLLGRLQITSET